MTDTFELTDEVKRILEAVLFAAGHPLSYEKLASVFEITPSVMKKAVEEFAEEYNAPENVRGIILLLFDDCCQLTTKEDYIKEIRIALSIRRGGNLSASSVETLAIVAYNQPVTRAYIDTVRGVDSSYAVNSLIERGLIESKSRLDAPGKPMLFTTTTAFLRCFGLNSLEELPDLSSGGAEMLDTLKDSFEGAEELTDTAEPNDTVEQTDAAEPNDTVEQIENLHDEIQDEIKNEIRSEINEEIQNEIQDEIQNEIRSEINEEIQNDIQDEIKEEIDGEIGGGESETTSDNSTIEN